MNEMQVFKYNQKDITMKIDDKGSPWWMASEICDIMNIENVGNVLARLDEDEKDDIHSTDDIGRQVKRVFINESGLYSLILGSKKPEAKDFKKWVTSEVLPSIRKTGQYSVTPMSVEEHLMLSSKASYEQSIKIKAIETKVDTLEIKTDERIKTIEKRLVSEKINQFPKDCARRDWITDKFFPGMSPDRVSGWLQLINHPIEAYRYTTEQHTVATVPTFRLEGLKEAAEKLMQESNFIKETKMNRIYNHYVFGRFYIKTTLNHQLMS